MKSKKEKGIFQDVPKSDYEIEKPLKDWEIHHNEHHIFIKEGEPVTVPRIFLQNLVTEKVIKSLPKEG